ncbi:uncharacterized protein METZ01_LOCUS261673 [marine metagenome]|uniref:Lipoyl-binding domain-containing protein n=1 Tax=marine metagenome TaxID=408172 RepID=A0A382JAX8_9ZZZZ
MNNKLQIRVGTRWYQVEVEDIASDPIRVLVDGEMYEVSLTDTGIVSEQEKNSQSRLFSINSDEMEDIHKSQNGGHKFFNSPMSGSVISISVNIGDLLEIGDQVCILESMKMQQIVITDVAGEVTRIVVDPGDQVSQGAPLIVLC